MSTPLALLAAAGGIAVVLAWVLTVIDVVRRPGLSRRARLGWVVLVSLVVPTTLLWLLVRPTSASLDLVAEPLPADDPRVRLVDLVEARAAGAVAGRDHRAALAALWPLTRPAAPDPAAPGIVPPE